MAQPISPLTGQPMQSDGGGLGLPWFDKAQALARGLLGYGNSSGSVVNDPVAQYPGYRDAGEVGGLLSNAVPLVKGLLGIGAATAPLVGYMSAATRRGAASVPSKMRQSGAVMGGSSEGPRAEALRIAQRNAAKPVSEGGLGLPPDNTPMDRAKAMGFEDVLHGTSANIEQVKTQGRRYVNPLYVTESNDTVSQNFANQFANTKPEIGSPTIYPMMIDRKKVVDTRQGVPSELSHAADESYSSLDIRDSGLPGWGQANNWATAARDRGIRGVLLDERPNLRSIAVLDPSIIRSRFAAFDPARRNEADLLGRIDPTLLGLLGSASGGYVGARFIGDKAK